MAGRPLRRARQEIARNNTVLGVETRPNINTLNGAFDAVRIVGPLKQPPRKFVAIGYRNRLQPSYFVVIFEEGSLKYTVVYSNIPTPRETDILAKQVYETYIK